MKGISAAVEISALGNKYPSAAGDRWVVRGLDLVVPHGTIYGLLGRNGAGKTTTLRSLIGLVRPDEGEIRVLGARLPEALPRVSSRVGALIDGPRLDASFSARRNLGVLARLRRIPAARIDEVLEIVGLTESADDVLASYSLGMRQRAGLAMALLGGPDLLVLDEPTNGLDPGGIVATRDLLRRLHDEARHDDPALVAPAE